MTRSQSLLRVALALLLGVAAALMISCSSSGKGLIPLADAGPLQSDFEAVANAAENGDGACTSTESALLKTDQDLAALPPSIDSGLRERLRQGVENLRTRALALCAQPLPQSTVTTTTPKTTTSTTTTTPPPETTPTETQTAPPAETEGPSGPGGGTPAPSEEVEEESPGIGKGEGGGRGHGGVGGIGAGGDGGGD